MLNLTDAFSLDACIYPEEADFCGIADDIKASGPVSYTHLTLPTT